MATALYSNPPLADFILHEANGQRSRDNVLVTQTGAAVASGSLLKAVASGSATFAMSGGATGNPTIGAITVGAAAADGIYTLTFTSATAYNLVGPNGVLVKAGTLGTAFSGGGIGFTLTAGTTAAVAGDSATMNVTAAGLVFVAYDGTGAATAILYSALPAATGNAKAVAFTADCEVKRTALIGLDKAAETSLATVGIKVRGKDGLPGIHTPAL